MKLGTPRWRTPFVLTVVLLLAGLMAPTALAVPASATASVTPLPPPSPPVSFAGATQSHTFSLAPTSGTIGSFNLTAPSGWTIISLVSPPAGITSSATQIQGRQLDLSPSSPLNLTFTTQAPCTPRNATWSLVAKSGTTLNGQPVNVNQPTTELSGSCTAAFVAQPADAEFGANTDGPSQNITSVAYTANGAAIQAIVKDAGGAARPGISVTLAFATNPTSATLRGGGSLTAVSDASGIATFDGTCAQCSPITIDKIGQGYKLKAEGSGVVGTAQPDAFGIYQEGEACTTSPCVVHGHNGNNSIRTTVSAGAGELGTFVSDAVDVRCAGYTPLTGDAIVWKYVGTGGGSQTIVIDLSKSIIRQIVDRGSDHLDFCFDSEGKPFTDKFGDVHQGNGDNGLLSDCNTGIDPANCIVSQTGLSGGGRRVTVIVADGRGKI